jgi:hypothetical protein
VVEVNMLNSRVFWNMLRLGTIVLFLALIFAGYLVNAPWLGWMLVGLLFLLHVSELPSAFRAGRAKGLSTARILFMDLLFGFTWWLPLRRGVFEK